ncbi:MAG: TMAO reductase system periplasmic protein TorT [Xanthobacteraceae bacterium]|jgi:protein TorT
MMRSAVVSGALAAGALLAFAGSDAQSQNKKWYPFPVEEHRPAFDMGSPVTEVMYAPLQKADKKWDICVSFPHLKDAYWLAVDYGVATEAKDLGAAMHLVEAGGYTNLAKQISQIEDCASNGAQAVVVGAISLDGLNETVKRLHDKNIPVVDLVNGISSKDIAAKSLVSFETMGYKAGEYIAKLHSKGSPETAVAWFPGPPGAGWVEAGNKGFNEAIKDSAIKVVATKYGDTGKEVQLKLVEDTIQASPTIKYIVGTSPTTEAAVQLLRERNLSDKIEVLAYYFAPGVYENIKAGRVMAAPTDSAVVQGRVAIDQAVRVLEGKDYLKHVGPKIYVIDKSNISSFDYDSSLAPADWKPVFTVN